MDPEMLAAMMGSGGGSSPLDYAGVVTKMLAGIGKGYAQADLDKFSASLADNNAEIARLSGGIASAKGALDIGRTASAVSQAVAGASAHYGAAGLDPVFGSPLLAQMHSVMAGEADKGIINARTSSALASAEAARASAVAQASSLRMKASQDIMAGFIGAGTAAMTIGGKTLAGTKWPWEKGAKGDISPTWSYAEGDEG